MAILARITRWLTGSERRSAVEPKTFAEIFGYGSSSAGETINESTALTCSAYFCGVNAIASACAAMPFKAYRKTAAGRAVASDHAVHALLNSRPNAEQTPFAFRWYLYACALIWGTGFAEIQRNRAGKPAALWPIHPSRMTWKRVGGRIKWNVKSDPGMTPVTLDDADVLRVYVFSRDGVCGAGMLEVMAESLGIQLASDKYLASFLANNARPDGLFEAPENLSPEQMEKLRSSWNKVHQGAKKTGRLGVLPPGVKFHEVSISPEAMQFMELRKASIGDFARFFNLPLSRLRNLDRATWSNYEQETLAFYSETLTPWLLALAQEATWKLFFESERMAGLYVKALFNAIMWADIATRKEYFATALQNGWMTINEVRELEELNGLGADGDVARVQMQMTPIGNDTEEQRAVAELAFKREVIKGLIADGTIGDVIFNLMEGRKLLEAANLPINPGSPEEPWLPVIADNGELVSGEVIEDPAGDVVGGATVSTPEDETEPPPGDGKGEEEGKRQEARGKSKDGASANLRPTAYSLQPVFQPLIRDACRRVCTRMADRLRRAMAKNEAGGDVQRAAIDVALENVKGQAGMSLAPVGAAWQALTRRTCDLRPAIEAFVGERRAELETDGAAINADAWAQRLTALMIEVLDGA